MILKKKKTEKSNLGILGGKFLATICFLLSPHSPFPCLNSLGHGSFIISDAEDWCMFCFLFFIFDLGVECMTRRDHLHTVFGATLSPITDLPTLESI